MCTQYSPENRHLYYPKPPKKPHKNTTLTPDDFPAEVERQRILAEKKRIKDEKKRKKLEAEGKTVEAEAGQSKPKRKRLRRKVASPPPATSDDDRAHEAAIEAAAASLNDSIQDPAADADDESDGTPDAPPAKKQKLRISLKKKPGEDCRTSCCPCFPLPHRHHQLSYGTSIGFKASPPRCCH